ncbi:MAG: aminopeptidase P family protein [Oscillospiraceae bacterium]|nr:aminopeptidase P family protein [Oscillospiraceae bacterium]
MFALKARAEKIIKLLELTRTDACVVKSVENRRYLTGLATSAGMVVITRKGNRYVVVDDRYEEIATKQLVPQGFIVRGLLNYDNYAEIMYDIVQSDHISVMLLESDGISHEEYVKFENSMYSKVMPLKAQLNKIRAVKDFEELENIKTAQRISEKVFDDMLEYIKPGMTEKQVEAKIVQSLLENGSDLAKFHMCCVSGANSSLIHGAATDRVIEKGDPLLLDFGAIYKGYRSSMSRTICVGKPSADFERAYQAVKTASVMAARYVRAGAEAQTVDEEIRRFIEEMGYGGNFRHAAGHGIGLDYIELPIVGHKSTELLNVGNLMVIEPGVYLKGEYGIRIGDLFYIGENGTENLTKTTKELIIL